MLGYPKIEGSAVDARQLITHKAELHRLGEFLDALHRIPVSDALATGLAPLTPHGWRQQWALAWKRYRRALTLLPAELQSEAERRWERFLSDDANFDFEPRLLHADLTPQHVLWDAGRISGVIDWTDAQIGDTALDFAWPLSLSDTAADVVLAGHSTHEVTGLRARARFYEWTGWWSYMVHGLEISDRPYLERGLAGVMRQMV